MEIRYAVNPKDVKTYHTERLREEFLIDGLFVPGETKTVYSHVDRIITGSVCPVRPILLDVGKELKAQYFLERREMGIINIGSKGAVVVDGVRHDLDTRDGLYIGMGSKEIEFISEDPDNPSKFYFSSTPAHESLPIEKIEIRKSEPVKLGSQNEANQRTIYKYIHPQGVKSCQLVMGMTILEPGSVWNTMPCHTHDRRMEVYLYFDLPQDAVVFHYMGEPTETRHIVIRNEQAVISPSWSIHSGCGTTNYSFIWSMAGENQVFTDIDAVSMKEIK
ncbi:MAG: 5-dehydro-4-deoxy-D-glucuronate isomerase [Clostridia bacterium]|nr:5-dehydro-4-deoxy-D-glucuronate isomerase [Clostridia bacterium]